MRTALARSNWRRALAQSNLRRAGAEQLAQTNLRRAPAQCACAEQLAQSTCAEQLAQSTCAEQLAQSTCAQQLAESNLRAAAWNNAACADHFREKSRGAVREESRMMRWSSHVTIHTEHRRAQTRSPQRCKKVSPGWMSTCGKMLSGQSSSSFFVTTAVCVCVGRLLLAGFSSVCLRSRLRLLTPSSTAKPRLAMAKAVVSVPNCSCDMPKCWIKVGPILAKLAARAPCPGMQGWAVRFGKRFGKFCRVLACPWPQPQFPAGRAEKSLRSPRRRRLDLHSACCCPQSGPTHAAAPIAAASAYLSKLNWIKK